ncbi:MAG TPA: spore germination protein [Bacillales bacterium]|nr:spore germination protein [Bacillales bacterium]
MPGVVGVLKVNSVGSSGVLHVGDVYSIAPNSALKTFAGAGSFNTGDYISIDNQHSVTRTIDEDTVDASNIGNA